MDMAPQGQEQLLWDAAALTQQQSWDWDAYYDQSGVGSSGAYVGKTVPKFPTENVGGWTMYVSVLSNLAQVLPTTHPQLTSMRAGWGVPDRYDHGVNNAMATKSCATWYRQSKNSTDNDKTRKKLEMQDKYHGQVLAIPSLPFPRFRSGCACSCVVGVETQLRPVFPTLR